MSERNQNEAQFDKLTIKIASDDVIRNEWSRGEIKKPNWTKLWFDPFAQEVRKSRTLG